MLNKEKKLVKYISCDIGGLHDYDNTSCNMIASTDEEGNIIKVFKGKCVDCGHSTVRVNCVLSKRGT